MKIPPVYDRPCFVIDFFYKDLSQFFFMIVSHLIGIGKIRYKTYSQRLRTLPKKKCDMDE